MPAEIGDDDPIPLAEACRIFLGGHLTKSSSRTEHRKGNLEIIRIANKDFVTRNGIKRMIEKCTDKGPEPREMRKTTPRAPQMTAQEAAKLKLRLLREKYDAETKSKRAAKKD